VTVWVVTPVVAENEHPPATDRPWPISPQEDALP